MYKFLITLFAIIITLSMAVAVQYSSFSSLKIIPSARECAMGGTGVTSALGPQAMYYNPALTSVLNSFAVNVNYMKWFLDMYEQSLFFVRPFSYFNLGLGVINFNPGKLDFRPDYPTEDPTGDFQPADFNFFLNLSKTTNQERYRTSFGISGRFYYQKIYEYTATGLGADLGLSVDLPSNFQMGFSIINFGTKMRFIREDFSLPTKFLAGLTYEIRNSTLNLIQGKICLDMGYLVYDKDLNLRGGLELSIKDKYFLRTGYKFGDESNHYNFGFGLIVKNIRIEYAFSPYDLNIGSTHHFSLSLGY